MAATLLLLLLSTLFAAASSDLSSDRTALLALHSAVGRSLKWNASDPSPCSWPGITCSSGAGASARVTQLHLPGVYLFGPLPAGALGNLTALRTLSLRLNRLSGTLPADLGRLSALRNLYLQGNSFSGEIPPAIFELVNLVRLNLASNNFSGRISPDFAKLTRLATLYLENNRFSGSLPNLPDIAQFNVSNNRLTGAVPAGLSGKEVAAFSGNDLCGGPLAPCPGQPTAPAANNGGGSSRKKHKGLSGGAIAGIVVGSVVALLAVLLLLFVCCRRGKSNPRTRSVDLAAVAKPPDGVLAVDKPAPPNGAHYASAAAAAAKAAASDAGAKRLIFFGSAAKVFDLEDLLRASAEVLGKGTFGTAYKGVLEMGMTVAVKRLKDVMMAEREFREKIESVGSMEHDNLVPLRAYYYSKGEKLLVYDYLINGSLSALLHGMTFSCSSSVLIF